MSTKNPKRSRLGKLSAATIRAKQRMARREAAMANKRRSSGGGTGGFWDNEIRIPSPRQDESGNVVTPPTQLIRLIPGEYEVPRHVSEDNPLFEGILPYYKHVEYYHPGRGKKGRGVQVPDTRDWCDGVDLSIWMMDQGDEDIGHRIMTYHSILHLGNWHRVGKEIEIRDRDTGAPKNIEVTDWKPCTGRHCEYCSQEVEVISGRPGYICLSPAIQRSLDDMENVISMFCSCGCSTPLKTISARCSECKEVFLEAQFDDYGDVEDPITISDVGSIYDQLAACPNCKAPLEEVATLDGSAFVEEELVCDGCANPTRANLYDADLAVVKKGLGPKVRMELDPSKFNARGFRIREIPESLAERAEVYDFFTKLKRKLSTIAKRLGVNLEETPFGEGAGYAPRKSPKKSSY